MYGNSRVHRNVYNVYDVNCVRLDPIYTIYGIYYVHIISYHHRPSGNQMRQWNILYLQMFFLFAAWWISSCHTMRFSAQLQRPTRLAIQRSPVELMKFVNRGESPGIHELHWVNPLINHDQSWIWNP